MGFCFQNQKQAKYFENGISNKWDSWPPFGQAEQNGIVAVVVCLILASHTTRTVFAPTHFNSTFMFQTHRVPVTMFPQYQTNKCVWKPGCMGIQKWVKTVERFKNNEGSMRGWLQSSGTVFYKQLWNPSFCFANFEVCMKMGFVSSLSKNKPLNGIPVYRETTVPTSWTE